MPPTRRNQKCGVGNHPVGKYGEPVYFDEKYVTLVQRLRKQFQPMYSVCKGCRDTITTVINRKIKKKRNNHSISTVLSTSSSTTDTIDEITLTRPPRNRTLNANNNSTTNNQSTSTSTSSSNDGNILQPSQPQANKSFDGPSTSAAAAARLQEITAKKGRSGFFVRDRGKRKQPDTIQELDSDDDVAINVAKGARLPHIQPAPKRRKVVTLNREVMDAYLVGITGG